MDKTKKRLYVEVYMLTEDKLINALFKAKNRRIDIKVILEKNPYQTSGINDDTYDFLSKNKIDVVWSNLDNYSLNHSKFIIADDELILST
jgi:phosphatidylserine/phosphatidylglycerophosphate/cardiolipin synthase-like enzyme